MVRLHLPVMGRAFRGGVVVDSSVHCQVRWGLHTASIMENVIAAMIVIAAMVVQIDPMRVMRERPHMPRMTAMVPPVPANRAAPADAAMEVFTAPIPAAAMPSGVIPAIAMPAVPIELLLTLGGSDFASNPPLRRLLGALR